MEKIFNKLKENNIETAILQEYQDFQFISLNQLFHNISNKKIYLFLVISNSIITYQLSGKGEKYWEEFANYFSKLQDINETNIIYKLIEFIQNSKNNKRLINIKIKRLNKFAKFLDIFIDNELYFYENMTIFRDKLAEFMNQKNDAKTIVFTVKMFGYSSRIYFNKLIIFPENISIPLDSRLQTIFKLYNENNEISIKNFYKILSKKLNIPELHLDSIIWCNYEKLIKN